MDIMPVLVRAAVVARRLLVSNSGPYNLVVPSKENVGKILEKIHGYEEGREASGDRRTVWKGVKLVEKYREKDSLSIAAAPNNLTKAFSSTTIFLSIVF
jgi:hypothetical protein